MTEKIIMSFKWKDAGCWMKWTLTRNGYARLTTETDSKGWLRNKESINRMRHHFVEDDTNCDMFFSPSTYAKVRKD